MFLVLPFLFLFIISECHRVKVKQGTVIGIRQSTVFDKRLFYAFYGVPYAEEPVGNLRFKDPVALKSWKTPFNAKTEYHGACAQIHIVHKYGIYGTEDCLRLNIFTPNLPDSLYSNLKPVIVWIHGYAFTSSMSHVYGADFLIDNDVLLVTLTHRIGVFGFLKLDENDTHANMGLKDIVMGLKWIRSNIKHFGGDKERITVMGNGSAATFLSLLTVTKYKRFYSKIILQSGALFSSTMFQGDHVHEKYNLNQLLKKNGHRNLLETPTKDILYATQKIYSNKDVINSQRPLVPFNPIVERKSNTSLLTRENVNFAEEFKKIDMPILIGFNPQESLSEAMPFLHNPHYLKTFQTIFRFMVPFNDGCKYNYTTSTYKEIADIIKQEYFKENITENSLDAFLKYTSDLHKYPVIKFIKKLLQLGKNNMFVYKFNYQSNLNVFKATSLAESKVKVKGAAGGDELCYILKCEPLWESYAYDSKQKDSNNKKFIKEIARLWANFAKSGDPMKPKFNSNYTWPAISEHRGSVLLIQKYTKLINSNTEEKIYKFWNDLYNKYYCSKFCGSSTKHDEL